MINTVEDLKKALFTDKYIRSFDIELYEEEPLLIVAVRVSWGTRFKMLFSSRLIKDLRYRFEKIVDPIRDTGMKVNVYIVV